MIRMASVVALAFGFLSLSVVGFAQDEKKGKGKGAFADPEAQFKRMDENGDGKVSKEDHGVGPTRRKVHGVDNDSAGVIIITRTAGEGHRGEDIVRRHCHTANQGCSIDAVNRSDTCQN